MRLNSISFKGIYYSPDINLTNSIRSEVESDYHATCCRDMFVNQYVDSKGESYIVETVTDGHGFHVDFNKKYNINELEKRTADANKRFNKEFGIGLF